MDYLTNKEINGLKSDIKASEVALEAEKYTFGKILKENIGPKMMEELNKQEETVQQSDEQPMEKKKRFKLKELFGLYK